VKQIADGVYLLRGFPPNGINVYLMGDVIVDAATKHAPRRILRQVRAYRVTGHALTHAHPDHQGASKAICETLGVPFMVGEGDVEAMETGNIAGAQPDSALNKLID
jgi:glyoxylase-like metal-dependent hydrolase (beta-lactamase superfamily II)